MTEPVDVVLNLAPVDPSELDALVTLVREDAGIIPLNPVCLGCFPPWL
ncbi:hypothetical protein [Streptomyces tendae]